MRICLKTYRVLKKLDDMLESPKALNNLTIKVKNNKIKDEQWTISREY